jgi:transcription elongation factor GreA
MEKLPMTAEGLSHLEKELKHLKSVERPSVIKAISDAREHGDLSENAEYHAARERQGFIEGRILDLESKISRAEVIDISKLTGSNIKFGATITLIDVDSEDEIVYKIVGVDEADVKKHKISITSPLAKAMIGKTVGDTVEVVSPGGAKSYEIEKVVFI